jgi:glyoxylase-like metal-dependent hydrolase (beta-lactamase superfamily II)
MAFLQWTIGDVRITRVVETEAELPLSGLLPDASPAALEPHRDWLCPHFLDDEGNTTLSIHAFIVESQGLRILVDTCVGNHPIAGFDFGEASDQFLKDLAAAGSPRESIDVVLCTHLHFDHVGWNTMLEGERWVPTFPNARYLFAEVEWDHWKAELESGRDLEFASTLGNAVVPVIEAGLVDLVSGEHPVTDEVRLEPTPGHTPGHVAVRIASGGSEAMITGDLTHHPVQWAEPDWGMAADSDSKEAAATRRRLLAEHADGELLVIGTHYAVPCSGYLKSRGDGFIFAVQAPK